MPHFILEYTDNLKEEVNIHRLLDKVHECLLSFPEIIPIGGLRSRAIELNNYLVADGTEDDAFVHATLKIGKGRTEEQKQMIGDALFKTLTEHFQPIFEKRYLAISMEIYEFQRDTYKCNNIHERYK